jgi:hypothetical protein
VESGAAVRSRPEVGSGWNGFVNGVLGGWQAQGIWQFQSGRRRRGNDFFQGDPTKGFDECQFRAVDGHSIHHPSTCQTAIR